MNGVIAVRSLLVADIGVTSLVPVARIAAGMLPQGTDLPAISLLSVSSVDRNVPAPGAKPAIAAVSSGTSCKNSGNFMGALANSCLSLSRCREPASGANA